MIDEFSVSFFFISVIYRDMNVTILYNIVYIENSFVTFKKELVNTYFNSFLIISTKEV